jgi:tetratricopeptide (TPR) repeat protein
MLGEARYWLGEFDVAEEWLRKALALAGDADRVIAHAARFLADITLTIRGDDHLAAALFDRSLEAARRLGEPFALSRVLLMAGWVPYWRDRLDEAEDLFREALEVARAGGRRDAWAECRALVGLANVVSERGSEEEALALGLEALAIGEEAGQAFTAAIAHQTVAASMRRLLRLDEAAAHAETSVRTLRELGARWELAGALGDRGAIHRLAGRLDEAERDLREAFVLCRDLNERALVAWTAAELARTLALSGDTAAARAVLDDAPVRTAEADGVSGSALALAAAATALAEHDRGTALRKSKTAIEAGDAARGPNPHAAAVWWTGSLFGADAAGGDSLVREARERLERNGWRQALREPELLSAR